MGFFDILEALLKLGLPSAGLTWLMFHSLYERGEIDRDADHESVRENLKAMKKAHKKNKGSRRGGLLEQNWMRFGGGFYGVAALWTLIVVEIADFLGFIFNFPGFAKLFEDGIFSFVFDMIGNQIQNFITAAIWFNYWADGGTQMLMWGVMAYFGYWLGMNMAQRGMRPADLWSARD